MRFAWDENKNKANCTKHGVSFETAQLVFDDPHAISVQDRHECGEERWQTLGLVGGVVVLLVAHTYREQGNFEVIHIISARKATKREIQRYEHAR
ncbi:MAG: BrnT family toxin [Gammaproteobacteria bacterium]|nr:BrnT family toxin [Gammaproteobacteria bacterium]